MEQLQEELQDSSAEEDGSAEQDSSAEDDCEPLYENLSYDLESQYGQLPPALPPKPQFGQHGQLPALPTKPQFQGVQVFY